MRNVLVIALTGVTALSACSGGVYGKVLPRDDPIRCRPIDPDEDEAFVIPHATATLRVRDDPSQLPLCSILPTTSAKSGRSRGSKHTNVGAITGGVIGALAFLALIAGALICIRRRRRIRRGLWTKHHPSSQTRFEIVRGEMTPPPVPPKLLLDAPPLSSKEKGSSSDKGAGSSISRPIMNQYDSTENVPVTLAAPRAKRFSLPVEKIKRQERDMYATRSSGEGGSSLDLDSSSAVADPGCAPTEVIDIAGHGATQRSSSEDTSSLSMQLEDMRRQIASLKVARNPSRLGAPPRYSLENPDSALPPGAAAPVPGAAAASRMEIIS